MANKRVIVEADSEQGGTLEASHPGEASHNVLLSYKNTFDEMEWEITLDKSEWEDFINQNSNVIENDY